MFTGKIGLATKQILQADGSEFLNVPTQILNEAGEVIAVRNTGYPLDAKAETIKADSQAIIDLYNVNEQRKIDNAEQEARHAHADETINKLTDTVITPAQA